MKKQKFRRTDAHKYSKLGVRRKKKQVYRRAKGGENKIRLKMKGHLRNVSIGFRSEKKMRGLLNGLETVMIFNLEDLKNLGKEKIGIVAKIGDKKRREILDYAIKNDIKLSIDIKKALERIEEKLKKAKEKKEKIEEKKKVKEKKSKEKREKTKGEEKKTETKEEAVKYGVDAKENVEEKK